MVTDLRFAVLGPLRAWRGEVELELGSPQQLAVLAALLLRDGAPAMVEELIDVVWDDDPPRAAVGTIRTYVSRLRRVLGDAVTTTGGGYALQVPADAVDLNRFRRIIDDARRSAAAGSAEQAAACFREALALWPGTALAGIPGRYAEGQRVRLGDLRLSTVEARLAAEVAVGSPGSLPVEDLSEMVARHPLREGVRESLMLALYRAGRQADALGVYRDGAEYLREELGLEPGPSLARLHQRILTADPGLLRTVVTGEPGPLRAAEPVEAGLPGTVLTGVPGEHPVRPTSPEVPRLLPTATSDFTGRAAELAILTSALSGADTSIAGLAGLDGMGRTATAVEAGRRLIDTYPDGQLYVDLRDSPCSSELLADWLRAFGVPAADLPSTPSGRAHLLKAVTGGRRILLVLDNVETLDQVIALRQALPEAAVLLTTRRRLMGLTEATWVPLGRLSPDESGELLGRVAGVRRTEAEPEATRRLSELAGGRPLALRLLGERLLMRPEYGVGELADQLAAELDDLSGPTHHDCVIAEAPLVRAWAHLSPVQTRLLVVAAEWPGSFTAQDLVLRLDLPLHRVWSTLDVLVDLCLVSPAMEPGAFQLDALIRSFARRHDAELQVTPR